MTPKQTTPDRDVQKKLDLILRRQENIYKALVRLDTALSSIKIQTGDKVVRVYPFAIKGVTNAQLIDAYRRGLNIDQLCALCGWQYTPEQIYARLQKGGAM